jgi:hypothetical protein
MIIIDQAKRNKRGIITSLSQAISIMRILEVQPILHLTATQVIDICQVQILTSLDRFKHIEIVNQTLCLIQYNLQLLKGVWADRAMS